MVGPGRRVLAALAAETHSLPKPEAPRRAGLAVAPPAEPDLQYGDKPNRPRRANALITHYFGCGTTRIYGFFAVHPCGNFCFASSSETAGTMITSSPGFQFTGVATLCFAVN